MWKAGGPSGRLAGPRWNYGNALGDYFSSQESADDSKRYHKSALDNLGHHRGAHGEPVMVCRKLAASLATQFNLGGIIAVRLAVMTNQEAQKNYGDVAAVHPAALAARRAQGDQREPLVPSASLAAVGTWADQRDIAVVPAEPLAAKGTQMKQRGMTAVPSLAKAATVAQGEPVEVCKRLAATPWLPYRTLEGS
jgi:hypothetical protein